jgi:hypothetical protein
MASLTNPSDGGAPGVSSQTRFAFRQTPPPHPDTGLELDADAPLLAFTATDGETSRCNSRLEIQLGLS